MRLAVALLVLAVCPSAAALADAATPEIHAHRGGSVLAGAPAFAEETMPAFAHAFGRERAVLELDVKLTADRVPVVIHDDTLDRTTTCTGPVSAVTVARFLACGADVLGSGGTTAAAPSLTPVSTLAQVLAYARDAGARLNLEIKNLPGDNDFDPTSAYATTVADAIRASGFPQDRLIVQSFWPPNLDAAAARLPDADLSLLTFAASPLDPAFAVARGYAWLSPSGAPSPAYVAAAHAAGVKVVPYTLNTADAVRAAAGAGVDALITDDPVMARRALGRPEPADPAAPPAPAATPAPAGPAPSRAATRPPAVVRLRVLPARLATVRRRGVIRVRVTTTRPLAALELSARRGPRRIGRRTLTRLRAGTTTVALRVGRLRGRRATLTITAAGALTPTHTTARLR